MFFIIPKEQDKFERAYLVRKKLSLPVNVSSLMNFFQTVVKPTTKPLKHLVSINLSVFNLDSGLQQSFINKTRSEKIDFYCQCVQFLEKLIRNPDDRTISKQYNNPVVLATGFLRSRVFGRWDKVGLRINRETRKLVVVHAKSEAIINIDNYYCRRSKDASRKGVVLEPITHAAEGGVLRLAFEDGKFDEIAAVIENMVVDAAKFRFLKEMQEGIGDMIDVSLNNFGSLKNVESYDIENKMSGESIMGWTSYINAQMLEQFKGFCSTYFSQQRPSPGQLIFHSSSKRIHCNLSTYTLSELFALSPTDLMTSLKLPSDRWNKYIKQSVLIQKPQYEQLDVVYERCRWKEKTIDFIFLREDRSTTETMELFLKPVTLKNQFERLDKAYFEYIYVRVQVISEEEARLLVEVKGSREVGKEFMVGFLGEYSNLQQALIKDLSENRQPRQKWKLRSNRKQISEVSIEQQQKTNSSKIISGPTQGAVQNTILQNNLAENTIIVQAPTRPYQQCSVDNFDTFYHKPIANYEQQHNFSEDSYIRVRHSMKPNPASLTKQLLKIHYLFEDWDVAKHGGVVCKNEAMINEQKKVFGYVIKSLGKNLFKSRNILNISLPVGIFKKESHLQSIARNLSFAPILLEKASHSTPLQRLKLTMLYLVTVGVLGISMQKPFNPLLGETYQGWIDGCPVWIEQISHHPPISAYFMEGRGYRTFGKIQPKIELGMNSVKGLSEHQNTIQFENGDVLKLTFMKMVIHGLLFGDREFNFEHKNFVYDSQNAMFGEVFFGPKKSSYFGKSEQPQDYLYGRIVRVTPAFNSHMRVHGRKAWPQKQHIAEELCKFEGIWTEEISFDGVKYLDFRTDMPCEVVDQQFPLKSNPNYRKDIQRLKEGKLQEAQQQKQRIQQVQRRDRRLRQAHAKNKH